MVRGREKSWAVQSAANGVTNPCLRGERGASHLRHPLESRTLKMNSPLSFCFSFDFEWISQFASCLASRVCFCVLVFGFFETWTSKYLTLLQWFCLFCQRTVKIQPEQEPRAAASAGRVLPFPLMGCRQNHFSGYYSRKYNTKVCVLNSSLWIDDALITYAAKRIKK